MPPWLRMQVLVGWRRGKWEWEESEKRVRREWKRDASPETLEVSKSEGA